MKRLAWRIAYLGILLGFCLGATAAQLQWDNNAFMGINEIKAGMVGYGKTVYQGTKVETFDVEVVGVLKKLDFGFDMILIKITSGPVVERKMQSVSGMSGSPIYIDDRLIGAYAYSWNFQNEAIGGVTPIAAMLEVTQPGSVVPPLTGSLLPSQKVLHIGDRLITRASVVPTHEEATRLRDTVAPTTMVLTPVATPVFVSGLSEKALSPLQKMLDRYNMRAMPGPGEVDGPAPPLEPGAAVSVSLMEGDASMSAVGTVTYVKDDTVLAFGHPFFGLGKTDMPMSAAYVHGIISSSMSSFKLASPYGHSGRMFSDRQYAVAGIIGEKAKTLPVLINMKDPSRNFTRRYAAEMIDHPDFSPTLLYLYFIYGCTQQMGDIFWDDGLFTARMLTRTETLGDIEQHAVLSPKVSGGFLPFSDFYVLPSLLMQNPFGPVKMKDIFVDVTYQPDQKYAYIEKVVADRPMARPGERVNLTVKVRRYGDGLETLTVPVQVPQNATEPMMLVAVAGGTLWPMVKSLDTPVPQPEQGLKGIVDWLTYGPTEQSILAVRILPSPSYGYRGRFLRNLPATALDVLRFADTGIVPQAGGGDQGDGSPMPAYGSGMAPTAFVASQPMPYVVSGVQMIALAIETEDRAMQTEQSKSDFSLQLPMLSTSLGAPRTSERAEASDKMQLMSHGLQWMTSQQRARMAILQEALRGPAPAASAALPAMPTLVYRGTDHVLPLSLSLQADPQRRLPGFEAQPEAMSADEEAEGDGEESAEDDETTARPTDITVKAENVYGSLKNLLTKKQSSWGLTGQRDFLRGKHLGTAVTSKGDLVLAPAVRSIYQTNDMVPWRMVTVGDTTYLAGWGSNQIISLDAEGTSRVHFTRDGANVEAITGLTVDAGRNLIITTWPEQHALRIAPDGKVLNDWALPGNIVWDLVAGKDGKSYVACDDGMVYILRDDKAMPLQVACSVPDKLVVAMLTNAQGELLLATAPRGKVYRLRTDGQLASIYEGKGTVTSLETDAAGNLYVGVSPTCQVIRISPDGLKQEVMRGMGRGNRHVMAMRMVGNDLYVSTGPAGGVYRVSNADQTDVEVTPIFARADQRSGREEQEQVGPESVMVNALTVNARGEVFAACSTPGQVLKLMPRTEGAFLSTVLQTPVVTKWGRLDLQTQVDEGQSVTVESRSGNTAVPDATWSHWSPLVKDSSELTSPAALYAQFRVRLTGAETSPKLTYARLFYLPANQSPLIRLLAPSTGVYWSDTKDIRWEARDPDEDELTFHVYLSRDRGRNWVEMVKLAPPKPEDTPATAAKDGASLLAPEGDVHANPPATVTGEKAEPAKAEPKHAKPKATPIALGEVTAVTTPAPKDEEAKKTPDAPAPKKEDDGQLRAKSIPWNTKAGPDGAYMVKVVATDKFAKPTDPKSAEVISGVIMVDNTMPAISLDDKVYGWSAAERFIITDNVSPIVGGKYRINDGPWTALVAEDGMFNRRQEAVKLLTPAGEVTLTKGEYKLQIQVLDAAGNLLDRTVTVLSGEQPPRPAAKVPYLPVELEAGANDLFLLELLLRGLNDAP